MKKNKKWIFLIPIIITILKMVFLIPAKITGGIAGIDSFTYTTLFHIIKNNDASIIDGFLYTIMTKMYIYEGIIILAFSMISAFIMYKIMIKSEVNKNEKNDR